MNKLLIANGIYTKPNVSSSYLDGPVIITDETCILEYHPVIDNKIMTDVLGIPYNRVTLYKVNLELTNKARALRGYSKIDSLPIEYVQLVSLYGSYKINESDIVEILPKETIDTSTLLSFKPEILKNCQDSALTSKLTRFIDTYLITGRITYISKSDTFPITHRAEYLEINGPRGGRYQINCSFDIKEAYDKGLIEVLI